MQSGTALQLCRHTHKRFATLRRQDRCAARAARAQHLRDEPAAVVFCGAECKAQHEVRHRVLQLSCIPAIFSLQPCDSIQWAQTKHLTGLVLMWSAKRYTCSHVKGGSSKQQCAAVCSAMQQAKLRAQHDRARDDEHAKRRSCTFSGGTTPSSASATASPDLCGRHHLPCLDSAGTQDPSALQTDC